MHGVVRCGVRVRQVLHSLSWALLKEEGAARDAATVESYFARAIKLRREAEDDGAARFLLRFRRHGCTHCALVLSRCRACCAASRWSRLGERLRRAAGSKLSLRCRIHR